MGKWKKDVQTWSPQAFLILVVLRFNINLLINNLQILRVCSSLKYFPYYSLWTLVSGALVFLKYFKKR